MPEVTGEEIYDRLVTITGLLETMVETLREIHLTLGQIDSNTTS